MQGHAVAPGDFAQPAFERRIRLGGVVDISLTEDEMAHHPLTILDFQPNGMTLTVAASNGRQLYSQTYFSIGGGFVVTRDDQPNAVATDLSAFSHESAEELLALTDRYEMSISQLMMAYESVNCTEAQVCSRLFHIRDVMVACQQRIVS